MESPLLGRPNRETGLPPGVEVAPLGSRFAAYLINMSVPVVVGVALIFLLPATSGALRMTLGIIGAIIAIGWLAAVLYLLAVRAASPGLKVMKLQVVGFLDGRPIGLSRAFIRGLVFWALYVTGIGLLLMLIFELRHPRKQGWHDLTATAVMIKERVLAPAVQPARAAASAMQSPPSQVLNGSLQPNGARPAMPAGPMSPSYVGGEGYGSAGSPVPPGPLTPPPGMGGYPAGPASPYAGAAAMPQGGPNSPYGGNAYATPHPGSPYGPPQQYPPQDQYGAAGAELYAPGQGGQMPQPQNPQPQMPQPQMPQPQMPQAPNASPSGASPYEPMADDTAGNLAETSVAARSPYLEEWSILLDDGRRIALDGLILLGRNPQPTAGEEDAQLIKIADETRTVSKSHLAIGLDAGGVYVVDRGSTNGSTVSTTNGMSTRCKAGEMVRVGEGAIVSIGDHWLEITRGS
jgi:uncharacterized RDD family membrane protein YckC